MATRQFADLSSYRKALDNAQGTTDLLNTILGGVQQGIQLQRLPQTIQENAVAQQLQNAINLQKLQDLQNPQAAIARDIERELTVKGALNADLGLSNLARGLGTIGVPGAITAQQQAALPSNEVLALREAAALQGGINIPTVLPTAQAGLPITEVAPFGIPTGVYKDPNAVLAANQRATDAGLDKLRQELTLRNEFSNKTHDLAPGAKLFDSAGKLLAENPANSTTSRNVVVAPGSVVIGADGKEIFRNSSVTKTSDLKPSERLAAQREIRLTYDDRPSKLDYFGKGQIMGSNQLKTRLDAVLKPVKGDYSKLNPQAKQTFVFALNKLRDPTSATLLAEASQIAERAGIGAKFNAVISNLREGDILPDQVAKDIYEVISQVESAHRENLIIDLIETKKDTDELGIELTRIGVPKNVQDEVERRFLDPDLQTPAVTAPVVKSTTLSSSENFPSEEAARAAGFKNGALIIINGVKGNLE